VTSSIAWVFRALGTVKRLSVTIAVRFRQVFQSLVMVSGDHSGPNRRAWTCREGETPTEPPQKAVRWESRPPEGLSVYVGAVSASRG